MSWETVIGLEVHAQLKTRTKLFCGCAIEFGAPPNTHVCPVCLGMPGVLPVLNEAAVMLAVRAAVATGCEIHATDGSVFARKNYFYPDLPKGYQISQFDRPLATGGGVEIGSKTIGLTRIHMEEDAGKLVHGSGGAFEDADHSFVDLNRAGVPLIEIVSEPEIRSPEEAGRYLRTLRSILIYLDVTGGDMEKGEFRCDANVSLRKPGAELGTRVELKNMNSFRFVERGLAYEVERQAGVLDDGRAVAQETRLWNEAKAITLSMRGKEEAHDYRYFPDPDLIPLVFDTVVRADQLPELGHQKAARYATELGLPATDAEVLTSDPGIARLFDDMVEAGSSPKTAANWIMGELLAALRKSGESLETLRFSAAQFHSLLGLVEDGTISGKIAKDVFQRMFETGDQPKDIVEELGLKQISDPGALGKIVDEVLAAHPTEVADFKAGNSKLRGFFVGQVMKRTKGQANPKVVQEILSEKLK